MAPPLERIRVADLTQVVAGPVATRFLADFGAEVIKIEPIEGEAYRQSRVTASDGPGENVNIVRWTAGKKSIALNLKSSEGKQVLKRLLGRCDVLVENFRPGKLESLGFGWDDVHAINDQLIYASISGFGAEGEYSSRPAYAIIAEAMGGLTGLAVGSDGEPVWLGFAMADVFAGALALSGILAAIIHREQLGLGTQVDVSMWDGAIFMNDLDVMLAGLGRQSGSGHALQSPWGVYPTLTGHVVVAVMTDGHWRALCDAIGRLDLKSDAKLQDGKGRATCDANVVRPALEEWTRVHDRDDVVTRFVEAGIPVAPVVEAHELLSNPIVRERGMVRSVDDPTHGPVSIVGNPIRMSGAPIHGATTVPALGTDTRDVLKAVGFHDDEIRKLLRAGAIGGVQV